MKKSFLFKGVSVLGAMLLLTTSVMPGLQYAYADPAPESESLVWDYVYDETSWNAAYEKENSRLAMYYEDYPAEDLYCTSTNTGATFNDKVYTAQICNDSTCSNPINKTLTTTYYDEVYQIVSDGENSYLLTMDAEVGDDIYQLYQQQTLCTIPEGASSDAYFPTVVSVEYGEHSWAEPDWGCNYAVPFGNNNLCTIPEGAPSDAFFPTIVSAEYGEHSWAEPDWGCNYAVPFEATEDECIAPQGADFEDWMVTDQGVCYYRVHAVQPTACTLPSTAPQGAIFADWMVTDQGVCYYQAPAVQPQIISSGKYVKLLSSSYPNCNVSYQGRNLNGGIAWGVVNFSDAFNGRISVRYNGGDSIYVDEGQTRNISTGGYFIFSISHALGDSYDPSTFNKDDLSIQLELPLVDVNPGTTATLSGTSTSLGDISNIQIVDSEDEISQGSSHKIVLEQDDEVGDTPEADKTILENAVTTDLVQQSSGGTTMKAVVLGVLDLTFWNVPAVGNGDKSKIDGAIIFSKPIKIKIRTNTGAKIGVKHNDDTKYGTDLLVMQPDVSCDSIDDSVKYTGNVINPNGSGDVEIWTCGASTFVAYTETQNKSSSSSSSSSGGGGGGSSHKTETKAETGSVATGDTAEADTTDTTGAEEGTSEETPVLSTAEEEAAVAKFGQEQIDAYKWALKNGITTMKTVDAARLDKPLTRAELAKMMVVYIQKVLEKEPAITGDVTYTDVSESLGDLAGYIKLAYQYQIMGINADGTPIELFNPNGLVTRGEYATVFSRVLFGDKFNKEGTDFYTNHLSALEKAGVLKDTTPTMKEIRGWVMLMMYRSSQNADDIQAVAAETEEATEEAASESTEEIVSIANPAAEYCVAQGGESVIMTDEDGSQYGVCKLADGTEVDEWEYFRANNT